MTDKNPYIDLDEKGVKEQLALFKEALEGKETIDLYTEFELEKPKEITDEEKANIAVLNENNDKLAEITKLLGVSQNKEGTQSHEPSPAEKELLVRQEKLEKSAFSDKVADIKKIDADFSAETIEALDIPTSEKITVMSTVADIVTKYEAGYAKLKTELSSKGAKEATSKLSSGKQEENIIDNPDNAKEGAGKAIVAKFAEKLSYKLEESTPETK